jgi:transcriptional regulator with XRE-family HTH domain
MQICMKLLPDARDNLAAEIGRRFEASGLSYADIARESNVDPAQVGRICRGEFKTASANLMQICFILGIESRYLPPDTSPEETHRRRLEAGVLEIWDRTPQDAQRILKFLRQLAELRRTA